MDIGQHLGSLGLAQEGDHRNDDQQGFEPLAQQDGEGAQKGRCAARRVRGQGRIGVIEQAIEHLDTGRYLVSGPTLLKRGAEFAHGAFDMTHERCVARGQHRLERLEPVEIGRQR